MKKLLAVFSLAVLFAATSYKFMEKWNRELKPMYQGIFCAYQGFLRVNPLMVVKPGFFGPVGVRLAAA
jgi:peptidoglycan/LPS O-acetylase OafA/YrhL